MASESWQDVASVYQAGRGRGGSTCCAVSGPQGQKSAEGKVQLRGAARCCQAFRLLLSGSRSEQFVLRALASGHSESPWRVGGLGRDEPPLYSELYRSPVGALKMERHCPLTNSVSHNLKTTRSELQCLWASPGEGPNTITHGGTEVGRLR